MKIQVPNLEILKEYEHKGIVRLQEEEYIRCKKCGEPIDIQEFKDNSIVDCPKCNHFCGLSTTRYKRTVISEVNRKKIISNLDTQIRNAFGKLNVTFDKFEYNWTIQHDGKKYLLYIYGFSTIASFLSISDNEGVILYLDKRKILSQIHNLNEARFRYVLDTVFSKIRKTYGRLLIHWISQKHWII